MCSREDLSLDGIIDAVRANRKVGEPIFVPFSNCWVILT
jgi:hypothetical protein